MPKFSIIVTSYNLEEYINKCIDSILDQTYGDFELICVDDGSTDKTLQILHKYEQIDNRISVIHQQNQGVSSARNLGLSIANTEYVWFIDGDDYIEKNALEEISLTLDKKPDIIYIKQNFIINGNQYPCKISKNFNKNSLSNFFENMDKFINDDILVYAWNKIINRKFIIQNNIKFINGCSHGEDSLFVYQLLEKDPCIYCLNKALYNQIIDRKESVTHISHFNFIEKIKLMREIFQKLPNLKQNIYEIKLHDYMYDFIIRLFLSKWRYCYFEDKENYLQNFFNIEKEYKLNPWNYTYYKEFRQYLLLSNLRLCFLYWYVIHPMIKYSLVLPYRKIMRFLKRQKCLN